METNYYTVLDVREVCGYAPDRKNVSGQLAPYFRKIIIIVKSNTEPKGVRARLNIDTAKPYSPDIDVLVRGDTIRVRESLVLRSHMVESIEIV